MRAVAAALSPRPIAVAESDLDDLRDRLRRTRWPDRETVDDWSQGIPLAYVQEVCRYWADEYDWRRVEAELNGFEQLRYTDPTGLGIQVLHAPSPEAAALPLVVTHGWPGSVVEFLDVIEPLRDPASHGGDPTDAFHVVCPATGSATSRTRRAGAPSASPTAGPASWPRSATPTTAPRAATGVPP
jgi:hypothetical protein